jgi:DnaD/phage-associated family protein
LSAPSTFPGFPDRLSYIPLPAPFFGQLLREIDDLAELKVCLHVWRLLQSQRQPPRFVRRAALAADRGLLLAIRRPNEDAHQTLDAALERAVERGVLLRLNVTTEGREETLLFLHMPANRVLIDRVQRGEVRLGPFESIPATMIPASLPRPGISELYEQNVGLLTPLIAEELREAELRYPPDWVETAFREAVSYNKRNWRYIRGILERWESQGRGEHGEARRRTGPPEDVSRFYEGIARGRIKR